jgi:hypothetical protein
MISGGSRDAGVQIIEYTPLLPLALLSDRAVFGWHQNR